MPVCASLPADHPTVLVDKLLNGATVWIHDGTGRQEVLSTPCWKGILVALVMFASTITLAAKEPAKADTGLKWTGDLATAWETAREQQRPLLLFVTMDGCPHCQKMKQTTLRDKDVQSDLQSGFIPVALNVKDEPELAKKLRLRLFPALVVIQPDGNVLESIGGYQTPKQLREKLSATIRQASREAKPRTKSLRRQAVAQTGLSRPRYHRTPLAARRGGVCLLRRQKSA